MKSEFKTALLIQSLIEQVRTDYSEIYDQWCNVGLTLAKHRGDSKEHAYEHLDANIDLVLRALEADQCKAHADFDDKIGGGVFFIKLAYLKCGYFPSMKLCGKPVKYRASQKIKKKTIAVEITAFVAVRLGQ